MLRVVDYYAVIFALETSQIDKMLSKTMVVHMNSKSYKQEDVDDDDDDDDDDVDDNNDDDNDDDDYSYQSKTTNSDNTQKQ